MNKLTQGIVGLTPLQNDLISKISEHTDVLDAWPSSHASVWGIMTDKYDIIIQGNGTMAVSSLNSSTNLFTTSLVSKDVSEIVSFFKSQSKSA